MARRGRGEGTVRQRADGRWEARVRLANGERQSIFARTQHDALAKLRAKRDELDAGLGDGSEPLARYLARWLGQRDPRTPPAGTKKLRYTTWSGYESRIRRHVLPRLGAVPIAKLTPDGIRALLAELAGDGLSATTVAMVRDTLSTAMRRAVKDRVLVFNPVEAVDAVARSRRLAYRLTAQQARELLRAAAGDPLEAVYVVALRAGLRQSEILGLRWRDVDLDAGTLAVTSALVRVTGEGLRDFDPKSAASAATIPLAPAAVAALRAHRARQVEQRFAVRDAWQDTGYVFTTELGTPISASNLLRRSFYPLCSRAGIPTRPGLRFHDLRHACGSLLISEGVKPKLVQAILRHSKLSTTMDLYVHAYDEDLREAVGTLDRALGGGAL